MVIYVDVDGTICWNSDSDYENSTPRWKQIHKINKLYDKGNTIIYWTARGTVTKIDWLELHEVKLKKGDVVRQRVGQPHQLFALTDGEVFEVSTQHFDEDSYRVFAGDSQ